MEQIKITILIFGILLMFFSLYFFISAIFLRLKKLNEEQIKNEWPRDIYSGVRLLEESADYKKFTITINSYIGDLNKTSSIMNIVSGITTLISGIALIISINI